MNLIYQLKNEQEFNAINGYVQRQGLTDVDNGPMWYYVVYDVGICVSIDYTNKHYVWHYENSAPFNNNCECKSLYDLVESSKYRIEQHIEYGTKPTLVVLI